MKKQLHLFVALLFSLPLYSQNITVEGGYIHFEEAPLVDALSAINEHTKLNLVYVHEQIPEGTFSFSGPLDKPDLAILALADQASLQMQVVGDQVILKGAPDQMEEQLLTRRTRSLPGSDEETAAPDSSILDSFKDEPELDTPIVQNPDTEVKRDTLKPQEYLEDLIRSLDQRVQSLRKRMAEDRKPSTEENNSGQAEENLDEQTDVEIQEPVEEEDMIFPDEEMYDEGDEEDERFYYPAEEKKNISLLQISFLPPLSTHGRRSTSTANLVSLNIFSGKNGGVRSVEVGGISNENQGDVYGLQVAGITNVTQGEVHAIQVSGIANVTSDDVSGISVSGITNVVRGRASGVLLSGIHNQAEDSGPLVAVAGISNRIEGKSYGIQVAGLTNTADTVRGIQVGGLSNYADVITGIQVGGLVNSARKVKGIQVGLINTAREVDGLMIGLINIGNHNHFELWYSDTYKLNGALKFGSRYFHNIFAASGLPNGGSGWAYGYGFGSKLLGPRTEKYERDGVTYHYQPSGLSLSTDLIFYQHQTNFTAPNFGSRWELNHSLQLRAMLGYETFGFTLFGGPVVSYHLSETPVTETNYSNLEGAVQMKNEQMTRRYERLYEYIFVGYNVGIRF